MKYLSNLVAEFRDISRCYADRAALQDSISVRTSLNMSAHDWASAAEMLERAIKVQLNHDYMASVSPEFHDAD